MSDIDRCDLCGVVHDVGYPCPSTRARVDAMMDATFRRVVERHRPALEAACAAPRETDASGGIPAGEVEKLAIEFAGRGIRMDDVWGRGAGDTLNEIAARLRALVARFAGGR